MLLVPWNQIQSKRLLDNIFFSDRRCKSRVRIRFCEMIRTPFFSSLNAYFAQFAQSAQKYEIKLVYSLDDRYHIEDVLNHFETSLTTYHLFIMLPQTFLFRFLAFNRIGSPAVCLKKMVYFQKKIHHIKI